MGLHRSLKTDQDLVTQEMSKRIFWALRLLVNDIATLSGMPILLRDDEIDQDLPTETNDMNIEKTRIVPPPDGEICYISGANYYTRLHMIRDKVTSRVYSVRSQSKLGKNRLPYHSISLASIHEIQADLNKWVDDIPYGFRLGGYCGETKLLRYGIFIPSSSRR